MDYYQGLKNIIVEENSAELKHKVIDLFHFITTKLSTDASVKLLMKSTMAMLTFVKTCYLRLLSQFGKIRIKLEGC